MSAQPEHDPRKWQAGKKHDDENQVVSTCPIGALPESTIKFDGVPFFCVLQFERRCASHHGSVDLHRLQQHALLELDADLDARGVGRTNLSFGRRRCEGHQRALLVAEGRLEMRALRRRHPARSRSLPLAHDLDVDVRDFEVQ
jgi:hypothetical protein